MSELAQPNEARDRLTIARERFPTPEDWIALQGGKPRVFRNPRNPQARWIVLHVYDEHDDPKRRFQSGLIVDTLADRTRDTSRYHIERTAEDEIDVEVSRRISREIEVPSFMVRAHHGEVCDARSATAGSKSGYDRIANQPAYERFIDGLRDQHMEELRFGVVKASGFAMIPLPGIRPPRPLGE